MILASAYVRVSSAVKWHFNFLALQRWHALEVLSRWVTVGQAVLPVRFLFHVVLGGWLLPPLSRLRDAIADVVDSLPCMGVAQGLDAGMRWYCRLWMEMRWVFREGTGFRFELSGEPDSTLFLLDVMEPAIVCCLCGRAPEFGTPRQFVSKVCFPGDPGDPIVEV